MDAIILCSGFGTRMESLGYFIPKALLPVGGRPLLDRTLDSIENAQDINRVIITTNKKFANQLEYYAKNKRRDYKKEIVLYSNNISDVKEAMGAIKDLNSTITNTNVQGEFLLILGDNFYDLDVNELVKEYKERKAAIITTHKLENIKEASRFGVVKVDGEEKIIEFKEKPQNPKSDIICTGLYVFPEGAKELIEKYLNESNHPDAMGRFIEWYLTKDIIYSHNYVGKWFDIGTIESYKQLFDQT